MSEIISRFFALLRVVTLWVENVVQGFFSVTTRYDVEEKIENLNKERDRIYVRYAHFTKLRRLKQHGYTVEHLKAFDSKEFADEELAAIYKNLEIVDSMLKTEQDSAYANKNETVVNLFLLNEKKKYFKCKLIAVLVLMISATSIAFLGVPYGAIFIGVALYVLFELKDQVVSYRVGKGYFGTTTSEAIELIKFIRENIDDIDSGDGGGAGRKILNPIKDATADDTQTTGELPNV